MHARRKSASGRTSSTFKDTGNISLSLEDQKKHLLGALQVDDFCEAGLWLHRLWKTSPSVSLASWIARTLGSFEDRFCRQSRRVAFLRSFTVEPAVQLLRAAAFVEGISVEPYIGQFNTYSQDLLDPDSDLHRFKPDVTFLCILTRSIAPELWGDFQCIPMQECDQIVKRVCEEFSRLIDAFRTYHQGCLVIHTLEAPRFPMAGIADSSSLTGQTECIRRINRFLVEEAGELPGVSVLDYEGLIRDFGASRWYDDARWESIRLPMTGDALERIASCWLRFVAATAQNLRKVLVCDLDNTLWHGVIGEDGYDGIELGATGQGGPHRNLQRVLLDLYHRGILLAICSKNSLSDAWPVIEHHPEMLLRPKHFAAVRINWSEKNINLAEIADELNVGIESLVFLDDNPHEQLLIRRTMPGVRVLDVGSDAVEYATAVRNEPGFERLHISHEDQNRGRMYLEQRARQDAMKASDDGLVSYLHSLQTVVTRVEVSSSNLDRIAQLTQKTNQFNLTTRRYSSGQIAEFNGSSQSQVLAWSVADRFGESGITGVAILRFQGGECEIDTLLLSCRVIGRSIETAMLFDIVRQVQRREATSIVGNYIQTLKNSPCAGFFEKHGFVACESGWIMNFSSGIAARVPEWITLVADDSEGSRS